MNRQLRTMARLAAIPGVVSAAFASVLPAGADFPPQQLTIIGRGNSDHLFAYVRGVSAGYFATLRIPVLQGEVCRDDSARPFRDVVVTRAWADRFFPGENPVGHQIQPQSLAGLSPQSIAAVAGDERENGLTKEPPPLMYTCGLMPYWPDPFFLVRTDPNRHVTVAAIREALREIEPNRALYSVAPLSETLIRTIAERRLNTILLTLFAATALLLTAIGLYGVLSQFVAARRREIGLRRAAQTDPMVALREQ